MKEMKSESALSRVSFPLVFLCLKGTKIDEN